VSDPALTVHTVLTDDLREWLTSELRYPVLAVNAADGPPSQSVMKYRQLQADPRVSLLFEDGLKWVSMRGTVELDATFEPALAHIQHLAVRYHGEPERYAGQERVIIRMRVEKVIRHD
jgi:hypothetical protein